MTTTLLRKGQIHPALQGIVEDGADIEMGFAGQVVRKNPTGGQRTAVNITRGTNLEFSVAFGWEENGAFHQCGYPAPTLNAQINGQAIAQARQIADQLQQGYDLPYTPRVFLDGKYD